MSTSFLKKKLFGTIVFVGIGNVLKGDDGFGSVLAASIKDKVSFKVFDTGLAPENYLGVVVKEAPDTIVLADSGDFGARPGEIGCFDSADLDDSAFFLTHNSSLKLLFQFIAMEGIQPEVCVVCLQPESMSFGEELSDGARNQLKILSDWFTSHFPKS